MITFKPFKAYRPQATIAHQVASRPYDVLNSDEALEEAKGNENSFLRIVKSEIDLPDISDSYDPKVYLKARENFKSFCDSGKFIQDSSDSFYVYRLTMEGRSQIGLVGCCHFQQYYDGLIKKHELTRTAKENDRVQHVEVLDANAEPVFFSYRAKPDLDLLIERLVEGEAEYDFFADDGVRHELWSCSDNIVNDQISKIFLEVPCLYVADGHHRTAAAARVGKKRKETNKNHLGTEEYNFFMAVLFPDNQLEIFDYNRVVKDLNGMSNDEFIIHLKKSFVVNATKSDCCKPTNIREFSLYLPGQWYKLTPLKKARSTDPVADLDVTLLSELVLDPILGITDLRKSERIDFVGGIRGLQELETRVDSGEMAAAFALYPVSMDQLISIADAGEIMPPKTTWFEPKLRSGLFVHSLSK